MATAVTDRRPSRLMSVAHFAPVLYIAAFLLAVIDRVFDLSSYVLPGVALLIWALANVAYMRHLARDCGRCQRLTEDTLRMLATGKRRQLWLFHRSAWLIAASFVPIVVSFLMPDHSIAEAVLQQLWLLMMGFGWQAALRHDQVWPYCPYCRARARAREAGCCQNATMTPETDTP